MKKSANAAAEIEALRPALETILKLAKSHGAEAAEAITAQGRSLSIGVREGELEDIDNSEGNDIGLRVFVGKRQASVSSSDLSPLSLGKLAERAVAMAKLAPEDPYCGLADTGKLADNTADLDVFDPKFLSAEELFARARELDNAARSLKGIAQADGANAYAVTSNMYFVTSNGFSKGWQSTQHGMSVSAIAQNETGMERDYDYAGARWFEDLPDPETIGLKAAKRALARLGSTQIKSAAMPVLFERRVAGSLLGSFVGAISGPAIARGVSFLKDAMHERVFSDEITITDDPFRLRGHGSRPWDGEGVVGEKMDLIANGKLTSWILNTATANQLGLETSGHAHRGISSAPGVSSSNTYMHAGKHSPAQLMSQINNGLLITEMFGPSLNSNTGDYSVGVAGFAIEKGERAHPVSEITIAGNLNEMFKSILPANDLIFDQPICTPSLMIDNMVVAGG